jgi:hypothetical protein
MDYGDAFNILVDSMLFYELKCVIIIREGLKKILPDEVKQGEKRIGGFYRVFSLE